MMPQAENHPNYEWLGLVVLHIVMILGTIKTQGILYAREGNIDYLTCL